MVPIPTLFHSSVLLAGPKHSTSVPFRAEVAGPLSVDEKEVALVPNPVPGAAVKARLPPLRPHKVLPVDKCGSVHQLLLPFTLQKVTPLLSPVTLHLKVKVSPGQVGGAAVNCPVTSPGEKQRIHTS